MKEYRLVDREQFEEFKGNLKTTTFNIGGVEVGTEKPLIIAGPCTVHSYRQTMEIAYGVKEAGADMLRGGAYKPRTSPYSFQGLGLEGLEILAEASKKTGLPLVTEVIDPRKVEEVGNYADVFQIGSRSMQNTELLKEVGKYATQNGQGVLIKTALQTTLLEVLCAAEYVAKEGAEKIILCERGMNITEGNMRNTPNPSFLLELREHTHFPVIGDPNHSTGETKYVSFAADMYLAAGANGLIIEVIRDDEPLDINGIPVCDRKQGLPLSKFRDYMDRIENKKVAQTWY